MRAPLLVAGVVVVSVATPAFAHRVDEYLQATTIAVARDRVQAEIRLTPGTAVFSNVRALIDTDFDGAFSPDEQRSYALRVLRDLTLEVDGHRLPLDLVASTFPSIDEMREGHGSIAIDFEAQVPRGGRDRRLDFENQHQESMAAYLVNGLVPEDPLVRFRSQERNYIQSVYRLEFTDEGGATRTPLIVSRADVTSWLIAVIVLVFSLTRILKHRVTRWSVLR